MFIAYGHTKCEFRIVSYRKLENVAINDVLLLKAARCDAIANWQRLWGLGHQIPNFDGYIYIQYAAAFISSRLTTFGCVRFPSATCGKHNTEFANGGWELWSYCKPFVDQSSRNFQTMYLHFPTPFSNCLCHVSFRRYSPLSLEVVEKRSKCKSFVAPDFCGRDASDFSTAVC